MDKIKVIMELDDLDLHFKDLFENTSDLIHYVRMDGTIKLVNSAWLNTLEYEDGEVTGNSIFEYLAPDCVEEYRTMRSVSMETRIPQNVRTTFISKSGREVNLEGQVACVFTNNSVPSFRSAETCRALLSTGPVPETKK